MGLDRRPTAAPLGWPCRSGLGAVEPAQKVRPSGADAWVGLGGKGAIAPSAPCSSHATRRRRGRTAAAARKANGEAGTAEARLCAAPPHQARRRGQEARLRSVSPRQQRGGGARRAASARDGAHKVARRVGDLCWPMSALVFLLNRKGLALKELGSCAYSFHFCQ